jgi:Xaa-Pro dipeptidase
MEIELYLNRIRQIQETLSLLQIGAQFVAAVPNFAYLLGVRPLGLERLLLLSIPGKGTPRLIVPKMSEAEFAAFVPYLQISAWEDGEDPLLLVRQEVKQLPTNLPISLDHGVPARVVLDLLRAFPSLVVGIEENAIDSLRVTKDANEIQHLQQAGAVADIAIACAIDGCRAGKTELEIASILISTLLQQGVEPDPPMPIVASGPNGAMPHHRTGHRRLVEGDAVVIDFGGRLNHYYSDITRTIHLGPPDPEFLRVYDLVRTAHAKALAAIKPGIPAGELDTIARNHIAQAGYGPYFNHRLGHGLGVDVHEEPYLLAGNREPVRTGMCFSIEPGVYLPGRFGVRIEDCVIVQESGPLILTRFPTDLIVK